MHVLYNYSLCRRAVVATFDLSAANLDAFESDHWLSCEQNVRVLRLTEVAYEESAAATPPALPVVGGAMGESPARPQPWKRRLVQTSP